MSEATGESPSLSERAIYIQDAARELRQAECDAYLGDQIYGDLGSSDANIVRAAVSSAVLNPGLEIALEDLTTDTLGERQMQLRGVASAKAEQAQKIESWAAVIFDHRGSEAHETIISNGILKTITPARVVRLDERRTDQAGRIEELRERNTQYAADGYLWLNIRTIDFGPAYAALEEGQPHTIEDLFAGLREHMKSELEQAELVADEQELVIETLRTGQVPSRLRKMLASELAIPLDDPNVIEPEDSIEFLEAALGVRAYRLLRRQGIHTVGVLTSKSMGDLSDIKHFGEPTARRTAKILGEFGLSLVVSDDQ